MPHGEKAQTVHNERMKQESKKRTDGPHHCRGARSQNNTIAIVKLISVGARLLGHSRPLGCPGRGTEVFTLGREVLGPPQASTPTHTLPTRTWVILP